MLLFHKPYSSAKVLGVKLIKVLLYKKKDTKVNLS